MNMNETEFRIRPYSKQELAMLYFPHCTRPKTAVANLRNMIQRCSGLPEALEAAGYRIYDKIFTPKQVRLIVKYLGEP